MKTWLIKINNRLATFCFYCAKIFHAIATILSEKAFSLGSKKKNRGVSNDKKK